MRRIDRHAGLAALLPTWATTASAVPAREVASSPRERPAHGSAGLRLRQGFETLRLWRERARGREQLRAFDDHLLRDIGITRLQAEAEAHKPFWRA